MIVIHIKPQKGLEEAYYQWSASGTQLQDKPIFYAQSYPQAEGQGRPEEGNCQEAAVAGRSSSGCKKPQSPVKLGIRNHINIR